MKSNLLKSVFLTAAVLMFLVQPSFAIMFEKSPGEQATTNTTDSAASINNAITEFKNLSKHDRKLRIADAKKQMREFKKEKRSGKADPSTDQLLLVILAILLPPLAVYLHEGEINGKFWLDLILTLIFWLPGIIYALIVIL